jgi:hypothetical protein
VRPGKVAYSSGCESRSGKAGQPPDREPSAEIMHTTARKLRGHYAYYGMSGNGKSISGFAYEVRMILFKWLIG